MKRAKHNLGTSTSKARRRSAVLPVVERVEGRRLMSGTLFVDNANGAGSITLDVNAGGGVETIVNGVKTDYSQGDWSNVVIETGSDSQPVNVKATVVPTTLTVGAGLVTFHDSHGMRDIKAVVTLETNAPVQQPPFTYHDNPYHIVFNDTGDTTPRNITMDYVNGSNVLNGMAIGNIFFLDHNIKEGPGTISMITGSGADNVQIDHVDQDDSLTINSSGGADTVTIGGSGWGGIAGQVNVNNSPSYTHLIVDYSMGASGVAVGGDGTTDFVDDYSSGYYENTVSFNVADVSDLTVRANQISGDVLVGRTDVPTNIVGTSAPQYLTSIFVGGSGGNGDMSYIVAPLSISNPTGYNDITFDDGADPSARLIQVYSNTITGLPSGTISWVTGDTHQVNVNPPVVGGNAVIVRNTAVPTWINCANSYWAYSALPDTVTISDNGSVQGINGAVYVTGPGNTNVNIDDSADTTSRNVALTSIPVTISDWFNSVDYPFGSLTGLAPAAINFEGYASMTSPVVIKGGSGGNTFTVTGTPTQYLNMSGGPTINLNTGTGSDTVNVLGTAGGTVLNIEGQSGFDVVKLGNAGNTQGIAGVVNVSNLAQYSQLTVDDSSDPIGRTITLDTLPLLGSHPWGTITGIAPGTINYRAYDMQDPITIKGGSGGNNIVINNTPLKTVSLSLGNTINLFTGTGTDHLTIGAISPGTTLNVDGQNGTDPVTVGLNGSVQGILGTVNLRNTSNYEAITVDDSADSADRLVTLGVLTGLGDGDPLASIMGLAPGIINFEAADVTNPTINGGSGANIYSVTGTPTTQANGLFGPTITLNAGDGANIINVLGMGNGTGLFVKGQGGDDSMTVDYSGGNIPLNSTITFDGGLPGAIGNSLAVKGGAADTFTTTAGNINRGLNGHLVYSNISNLFCNSGTFNVNGDLNLPAVIAQSAATTVNFNSSQNIWKLFVQDGAQASVASGGTNQLSLKSLSITNNGRLDLADNSMLITYAGNPDPIATLRGYLASAYDNGKWDGTGLTSSTAKNNPAHNTAIGYVDSADNLIPGLPVGSIKLKYTLVGDTNLDGSVDFNDFARVVANYGKPGWWDSGDFDYNATVGFNDFAATVANYGDQVNAANQNALAASATMSAASAGTQQSATGAAVPRIRRRH
jgi:hypothetical protein